MTDPSSPDPMWDRFDQDHAAVHAILADPANAEVKEALAAAINVRVWHENPTERDAETMYLVAHLLMDLRAAGFLVVDDPGDPYDLWAVAKHSTTDPVGFKVTTYPTTTGDTDADPR